MRSRDTVNSAPKLNDEEKEIACELFMSLVPHRCLTFMSLVPHRRARTHTHTQIACLTFMSLVPRRHEKFSKVLISSDFTKEIY
jgi:ATP adenylyltransferase/5',5'''-P-1,P-4-tetraphosphate phosphorylase II